jgi:hypothetical protein
MAGLRVLTFCIKCCQKCIYAKIDLNYEDKLILYMYTFIYFFIFFLFSEMQMDQLSITDLENVKLYNFVFLFTYL